MTKARLIGLFGVLFFFPFFSPRARAAVFNVPASDVYGPEGLVAVMNAANSNGEADTINLAQDSTYVLTSPSANYYGPTGLPLVSGNLTIEGNGATIVRQSATEFRMMVVMPGVELTLNNVVLSGGSIHGFGMPGAGIAAYGSNTLRILNSVIENNHTNYLGGGISSEGHVEIANSYIVGNSAAEGGGILAGSQINVVNSNFEDNLALSSGGGIRSFSILNVNNSRFVHNTTPVLNLNTPNYGGAISAGAIQANSISTIENSHFETNSAAYGGAIFAVADTTTLNNNTFLQNQGVYGGGLNYHSFNGRGSYTISRNTFDTNTAYRGAGISIRNHIIGSIIDNRFVGNDQSGVYTDLNLNGYATPQQDLMVRDNCFTQNNYGLWNDHPLLSVDATNNWWGAIDGPSGMATGSGDQVHGANVTYTPFLATGCPLDIVTYDFSGFFQPIQMNTLNEVRAGKSIAVKFSLNGDQGLDILSAGYPKSEAIVCNSGSQVNGIEETSTNPAGLNYDPANDQYTYIWKTESSWANTCRQLVLLLDDGTYHRADFKFK